MRALHVAAGNLYGGVERILVEIARSRSTAWQHEFALCFDGRLLAELRQAKSVCHTLGPVRFSRPMTVWRARRALRGVRDRGAFNALVCHSPWAFALAAPAMPPRRILWAHDALTGAHWTERRVARMLPDLVIANSRYTAEAIGRWLPEVPVEVVYAPVSTDVSGANARDDVRAELGAGKATTVILIACRFEVWKGHRPLIEAASKLRGDVAIWIAGGAQRPAEEELERELKALTSERGVNARVRFLGERRDVPRLLRGADILCQPNTAPEPFGVVFVEALYAGVPVVTADAGGAREIVTADCGVLVPLNDRDALPGALQSLVDSPERRATLGAAGPRRARALSDPAAQMACLERVLMPSGAEAVA
jgi:glycosyltransferase involved in cell wall biosynthesis